MKNQEQDNNHNNLNDPTVANDPQAQVEFDDLSISGEEEERVKGGYLQYKLKNTLVTGYNYSGSES